MFLRETRGHGPRRHGVRMLPYIAVLLDGVSPDVTSVAMPDAVGVRCLLPPRPPDVPPLFVFEGGASAALSVLLLARRPAYSALACCATIFAVDRLSAAPWMAGLLQAHISMSVVNLCSTTFPGRAGRRVTEVMGTQRRDGAKRQ